MNEDYKYNQVYDKDKPTNIEMESKSSHISIKTSYFLKEHIRDTIGAFIIAIFLTVIVRTFIIEAFEVQGISMHPTFYSNDRVIVSLLTPKIFKIRHNDIIVFHPPGNIHTQYIKRVIGISGDLLEIDGNKIYVNHIPLNQYYLSKINIDNRTHLHIKIPLGFYYVMGDNRLHSQDSRSFGLVSKNHIIGKVILRFWPLSRFKFF